MTGGFTLSLDFELGWGVIGNGRWKAREAAGVYTGLRPAMRRFLSLLDTLEIACVWAPVGSMIEPPNERDLSHLRGQFGSKARDFVANARSQTHDGRDLLDMILSSRVTHSFGTHGYSHVLFTDLEQDETSIATEIHRARSVNARYGLPADFLVFPENRAARFATVASRSIRTLRMPAQNATPSYSGRLARAFRTWSQPIHVVKDSVDGSGLRLHAASELISWGAGAGLPKRTLVRRRIKLSVRAAIQGAHVHFWLHPFNLSETPDLFDLVEPTLKSIAKARDAGLVEVRDPT